MKQFKASIIKPGDEEDTVVCKLYRFYGNQSLILLLAFENQPIGPGDEG
jgi:hypothetical protein